MLTQRRANDKPLLRFEQFLQDVWLPVTFTRAPINVSLSSNYVCCLCMYAVCSPTARDIAAKWGDRKGGSMADIVCRPTSRAISIVAY